MKRLLLLVSALAFCISLSAKDKLKPEWTAIGKGFEYAVIEQEIFGAPQCISIVRYKASLYRTDIVNDPSYEACTTPSGFGDRYGALAAINAGYFNGRLYPTVYTKENGEQEGWTRPVELFRVNGLVTAGGSEVKIQQCDTLDCYSSAAAYEDALASGPVLLLGGKVVAGPCSPGFDGINPRSVMGKRGGWIYLIVIDGRFAGRATGTTIMQTAELCRMLGLRDALNLDGGGSSALWARPAGVLSHPSDNRQYDHQGERKVPSAIIVTPAN